VRPERSEPRTVYIYFNQRFLFVFRHSLQAPLRHLHKSPQKRALSQAKRAPGTDVTRRASDANVIVVSFLPQTRLVLGSFNR